MATGVADGEYRLRAVVEGEFRRPRFSELGADVAAVDWDRARLAVGISDARAIQEETVVTWNGGRVAFLPGTAGLDDLGGGIHALVPVPEGEGQGEAEDRFAFSFPLALNGSGGVQVAPFGQNTVVELESDFPSPSFQGTWLPTDRSVSDEGFQARWAVPFLGRNYPQAWTSGRDMREDIEASRFGVAPSCSRRDGWTGSPWGAERAGSRRGPRWKERRRRHRRRAPEGGCGRASPSVGRTPLP